MYCCGDEPDGEAGRQDYPEGQVFSKTGKGDEEKQYARHNSPQRPRAVLRHQVEITGILYIKPYQHYQAGKRHHGDKAG